MPLTCCAAFRAPLNAIQTVAAAKERDEVLGLNGLLLKYKVPEHHSYIYTISLFSMLSLRWPHDYKQLGCYICIFS